MEMSHNPWLNFLLQEQNSGFVESWSTLQNMQDKWKAKTCRDVYILRNGIKSPG